VRSLGDSPFKGKDLRTSWDLISSSSTCFSFW